MQGEDICQLHGHIQSYGPSFKVDSDIETDHISLILTGYENN